METFSRTQKFRHAMNGSFIASDIIAANLQRLPTEESSHIQSKSKMYLDLLLLSSDCPKKILSALFRLIREDTRNTKNKITDDKPCMYFTNSGYVGVGGTPTLKTYCSEKNEIRMPSHLPSGMCKERIFATHEFW